MSALQKLPDLIASKDWKKAQQILVREASKKNASPDVFYNLGKTLEALGKYQQSGRWFQKAVSASSDYAVAWFELGRWQLSQKSRPNYLSDALVSFEKAYALTPLDDDARRSLARLRLRLGHWNSAWEAWLSFDDQEAQQARYRIAAETGDNTQEQMISLLQDLEHRPSVLKTLTRTARGKIPLNISM